MTERPPANVLAFLDQLAELVADHVLREIRAEQEGPKRVRRRRVGSLDDAAGLSLTLSARNVARGGRTV